MKKLLLILSLFAAPLSAGVLSNEMGMQQPGEWLGNAGSISTTNTDINGSYTANNSTGVALGLRFTSPVSQTNGNLTCYLYLAAKTGSPTTIRMDVLGGPRASEDPQRPSTATVLGVGSSTDVSGLTAPIWSTFTATGVSLSTGGTYWLNFTNESDTPASNFASFRNRALNLNYLGRITGWATASGYTTDPTAQGANASTEFSAVIKFDDGTLMGHPLVLNTAHASNANDRGVRYRFSSSIKVYGVICTGGIPTNAAHLKVYQGSTLISDLTLDTSLKANSPNQSMIFGNPITLSANTDYDFVFTGVPSATTAFGKIDANNSVATPDVLATILQNQSYVDGTIPGSYTIAPNATGPMVLMLDSFVPAAGSAGTSVYISGN